MARFTTVAAICTILLESAIAAAQPIAVPAEATITSSAAYTLGPGDKVRITVFGEEGLTNTYVVNADGSVAFPLIGSIPARGGSVDQLSEAIRSKLADGYVKDPRVSAEVINYRPYYLLGEVTKPGEFPYEAGLSVEQAVAAAGGYTYRANQHYAFIRRADDPVELKVSLRGMPVYVKPGDTIRIGERFF